MVQGREPEHLWRPEPHPPRAAAHADAAQEVPGGRAGHYAVGQHPQAQVWAPGEPLRGPGRAGGLRGPLGGGAGEVNIGREGRPQLWQHAVSGADIQQ